MRNTSLFEEKFGFIAMYLSFTEWSLVMRFGRTELNPGTKLRIQINSFSIQSRSWLLHTEIINTVCKRCNIYDNSCQGLKLGNSSYEEQYNIIRGGQNPIQSGSDRFGFLQTQTESVQTENLTHGDIGSIRMTRTKPNPNQPACSSPSNR